MARAIDLDDFAGHTLLYWILEVNKMHNKRAARVSKSKTLIVLSRYPNRVVALKDIELRLISELMRNSRRSDRVLAKALGVSQPTVSRVISNLEKQGILKEYTVIPDFAKIGLCLLAMTFVRRKKNISSEELAKAEKLVRENLEKTAFPQLVMIERGLGFNYDSVIVSLNKEYSDYVLLLNRIKSYPHIEASETQSFIIDLTTKSQLRPFTFQTLAKYLLTMQEQKRE